MYLWLENWKINVILFLCSPNFHAERNTLLNKITKIDSNILNQIDANEDTST